MPDAALGALLFAVMMLFLVAASGLAASWVLLAGRKGWPAVGAATLAAVLTMGVLLMAGSRWDASFLWAQAGGYLTRTCETMATQWAQAGVPADRLDALRSVCRQYIVLSFPAWLVLLCVTIGMITATGAGHLLSRTTGTVERPAPFRRWVYPEPIIFGFLLACLLKLFLPPGGGDLHPQNLAANNLLVFFVGFYAIAGLSIVSHYFNKWRLPFLVRLIGYLLLARLGAETAALFGILDVWFDFRKIKRPPPQEAIS